MEVDDKNVSINGVLFLQCFVPWEKEQKKVSDLLQ